VNVCDCVRTEDRVLRSQKRLGSRVFCLYAGRIGAGRLPA
jgi:hypothetical protein